MAPAQELLVRRLARAFHWQELIESGRYESIGELADALEADWSYIRSMLTLATLAPDIVAPLVRAEVPSWLMIEQLMKGMPMLWEEQRKGFESRHDSERPRASLHHLPCHSSTEDKELASCTWSSSPATRTMGLPGSAESHAPATLRSPG